VRGGPSPREVERMLKIRKRRIVQEVSTLSEKKRKLNEAEKALQSIVLSYSSSVNAITAKLKSSDR